MMDSDASPVYAFLKNPSMLDFAGHLSAVFFVSGCNFRCGFCHNPELLGRQSERLSWARLESACRKFRDDWVDGAVIMGGEPTLADDLPEAIRFFKRLGWAVKLDTNGSRPGMMEQCLPLIDYVAMDVKAGPDGYARLTGFADVEAICESIRRVIAKARDYEFRTTVVESFHTDEEMHGIAGLVRGSRRYVLQPFVPREEQVDPAFNSMARTNPDCLARLRNLMRELLKDGATEVLVRGE